MENEIDFRQYIIVVLKNWYWILGFTILVAVITFYITTQITPLYQAEAIVTIGTPRMSIQFTNDIVTQNPQIEYDAFPALATSDGVLATVAQKINEQEIHLSNTTLPVNLELLQSIVEASSTRDRSLVELNVRLADPDVAAALVNLWADVFVDHSNTIYGQSAQQAESLVIGLTTAEEELVEIEKSLAQFRAETGQGLLSQRLENTSDQNSILDLNFPENRSTYSNFGFLGAELEAKAQTLVSIKARRDQLEALIIRASEAKKMVVEDGLDETTATVSLLVEAAQLTSEESPAAISLVLNFDESNPPSIEALLLTLESDLAAIEKTIEQQTIELNQLQVKMAGQQETFDKLSRQYRLKQEVYLSLARKVAENELGDDTVNPIRIASYATVPGNSVSPQKELATAAAGFVAFLMALSGVLIMDWWRQGSIEIGDPPPINVPKKDFHEIRSLAEVPESLEG